MRAPQLLDRQCVRSLVGAAEHEVRPSSASRHLDSEALIVVVRVSTDRATFFAIRVQGQPPFVPEQERPPEQEAFDELEERAHRSSSA
ncbi:MAG: hypothetical protein IT379_15070 [Deltaproteobacteria bacterium]|nr:hypothetical protein [Deltaproteobacteria bacterium]